MAAQFLAERKRLFPDEAELTAFDRSAVAGNHRKHLHTLALGPVDFSQDQTPGVIDDKQLSFGIVRIALIHF